MLDTRSSGILLHPTSLPGPRGIGELGLAARAFADWLAAAGQSFWQVLPLGPTGYGDSPYQSFSSFAGNPLLLDLDALAADGYLAPGDLAAAPAFSGEKVDFGPVIEWKSAMFAKAAAAFTQSQRPGHRAEFEQFCDAHADWLDAYALFAALKDRFGDAVWNTWDADIARREPAALEYWGRTLGGDVLRAKFLQWQFFRQWGALRGYARERGIRIIGDVPIFVAHDSADVWQNPDLFYLDDGGRPAVVAGVPPDYFSETGQLWGNPLYRWEAHAARGFDWWIARVRAALALADIVRMDHFRGFEAYWEVPAGEPTAIHGRWVPGPGAALFDALQAALGDLPIIAEDLGVITPPVTALRERYELPGMKILQFAFGAGADNPLPHTFERACVVYTGTHDNDTALGWLASASDEVRRHALDYLNSDGRDFAWDLIRAGLMSVANTFIAPMQDVLRLGSETRMNFPSKPSGNWDWRMPPGAAPPALAARLRRLTALYGRTVPTGRGEG